MIYRLDRKLTRILVLIFMFLAIIVVISFIALREREQDVTSVASVTASVVPAVPDAFTMARRTWREQGSDHYQMTVIGIGMPAPPAALHLIIENGAIVEESIIACDNPSDDYPENLCEPTRTWYGYLARHTIDDLFEQAAQCLVETRLALRDCPAVPDDFQQFATQDEMHQVAASCDINTGNERHSLCTVSFNTTYGYPEEIESYTPNVNDGGGSVTVTDFQLMNDSPP